MEIYIERFRQRDWHRQRQTHNAERRTQRERDGYMKRL